MAALYRLCSVALRPLFHQRTEVEAHVSGFGFSVVGDGGGLRTLFMDAVWGEADHTAGAAPYAETRPPTFPRFPRLVAHRPTRVRAIHHELARIWSTERAHYASPSGDDYGDWFIGELERVLHLFRHASENGHWVTSDPETLEKALSPAGLPRLPLPRAEPPRSYDPTSPPYPHAPHVVGVVGTLALGAVGLFTWRARRIAALRARR